MKALYLPDTSRRGPSRSKKRIISFSGGWHALSNAEGVLDAVARFYVLRVAQGVPPDLRCNRTHMKVPPAARQIVNAFLD